MNQPSDDEHQPQKPPPASEEGQEPEGKEPDKDGAPGSEGAKSAQSKSDETPRGSGGHFKPGVREVVAAVIAGVILIVIGIAIFHDGNSGGSGPTEGGPPLPRPPAAQQAKDDAVPDTKGPVKEKVWAPEALTFAEPFKLQGAGKPIPHNEFVMVSCKIYWPHPESVEEEGYWYRTISKPWKGLFSPANSFWNGDKPGQKPTHATDFRVRECPESEMPDG